MISRIRLPLAILALALVPATALASTVFNPKTDHSCGANPYALAVGDLNGDGKRDIVTANQVGNNISVLLGTGTGTFGVATDIPVGNHPLSVALGDVNGDGKLDIATANSVSNNVSVLLGNGDGTFGAVTNFATGTYPFCVAIGDLSGDGKPDLVVVNCNSFSVSVLLGDGAGSFGSRADYPTGMYPNSVAIGDLNGDGKLDLAVSNSSYNSVGIFLGTGGGAFGPMQQYGTATQPVSVALKDLNGDGKLDLATANNTGGSATVMLGDGSGGFGARTDYVTGASSSSVALGDVDGDGKPDLLVAVSGTDKISLRYGIGNGTFGSAQELGTGANPMSVALADFNGDAQPDLVAGNYTSSTVSVLLQPAPTSTSLASSANPNLVGTPVTFTATVTPSTATGTVTFLASGSAIASAPVTGGVATWTTSLSTGNWSLSARYEGDALLPPSTSTPPLTQVITPNSSTVNVAPPPGMITQNNPVRTVQVWISRNDPAPLMAYSVRIAVTVPLLTSPAGFHEGGYLKAVNPNTTFNVIDLGYSAGNYYYQVDGASLGAPCGSTVGSGPLFFVDLQGGAAGGSGIVWVQSVILRTCDNTGLVGLAGTASQVLIDLSAPSVHAVSPNGGERWHVGSPQTITWTASDPEGVAAIGLSYSIDGGATYSRGIASLTGNPGSYSWTVPDMPGSGVRVLVSAIDVNGNMSSDASDANLTFAYYGLTYAAGPGGTLTGSNYQPVTWNGSGTTVTAVPNSGYHFTGWSDGVSTAARTDVNVQNDVTVTANFAVNPFVAALTNLTAAQVRTGNSAGSTTGVTLSWTPTGNTVEVWRKGFGHYPEYDDDGGAVPVASSTYPPGAGWTLTSVTTSGGVDLTGTRDYYYYAAYQRDAYGTWSAVATTNGTLNYHLADWSDGTTLGVGNNSVAIEDVSALGAHYGLSGGAVAGFAYLDVGPTSDNSFAGRPLTDNLVSFEDLVILAMNFGAVSAPATGSLPALTGTPAVDLDAPAAVAPGAPVTARLTLGGGGTLMALSTQLAWNSSVVEPVGQAAGEWLARRGGVAFSAVPGTVDAAVMQAGALAGEGELATVEFRVLSAGDPQIRIVSIDGRDAANEKVSVASSVRPHAPSRTLLAPPRPNPFRQSATLTFTLARTGPVEVSLYSVDGRRVRTLARDVREAGEYALAWDGRDDGGAVAPAGVYYVILATPEGRFARNIAFLR
jgi:hypothetical protein